MLTSPPPVAANLVHLRMFKERIMPIIEELGRGGGTDLRPPDREVWYELHDVMHG